MGWIERSIRKSNRDIERAFTGSSTEDRKEARRERDVANAKAETDRLAAQSAQAALDDAKVKATAAEADKLRVAEELKNAQAELDDLKLEETDSCAAGCAAVENPVAKIAQAKAKEKVLALKTELEAATLSASESTTLVEETTVSAQSAQTQAEASQRAADEATKKVKSLNSGGVGGALRGALAAFSNGLEKAVNCISSGLKTALKFISKAVDKLMDIGVMLFMNSPIMLLVKLAAPDVAKKIEKVVEKMADAVGGVIKDTLAAAVSVVDSVGKSMVALTRGDLDAAGKTLAAGAMDAAMVAATVAGGVMVLAETAAVSVMSEVLPADAAMALGVLATMNPRGAVKSAVKAVDKFIPTAALSTVAAGMKNSAGDLGKLVPANGVSTVATKVANTAGNVADKGFVALSAIQQMSPVGELTPMQLLAAEIGMGVVASQAPDLLEKRKKGKAGTKPDHSDSSNKPNSSKSNEPGAKSKDTDKADGKTDKKAKKDDADKKPDRDFDMDFLGLNNPMFSGLMEGGDMGSNSVPDPLEQKQFLASYGGNIVGAARSDPSNGATPATSTAVKPKYRPTLAAQGIAEVDVAPTAKKGADVKA